MNRAHIPGFPNRMPRVDWLTYLQDFRDEEDDNASIHLIRFHMHVHKLKIRFSEDSLMKMIMASLEGEARKWYEGLKPGGLFSLKYFHIAFYEHYKGYFPFLSLVENCCDQFEDFIQYLESIDEDLESMDDEDMFEALYHFSSQVNCHDDQKMLVVDEINQEMKAVSHDLSSETNDYSSAPLYKIKKDI